MHIQNSPAKPTKTLFDRIGGEDKITELVKCFYDLIETHEAGREILRLHQDGHGLRHAREEQFNFLCGFLGGRRYYLEKHRHMNVKQMHEHVPIRKLDAKNWLACMKMAVRQCAISEPESKDLMAAFERVAQHLVNTED